MHTNVCIVCSFGILHTDTSSVLAYVIMYSYTVQEIHTYTHTHIHHPRMYIPRVLSMGRVVEYVWTTELGDYQVMSGGALLLLELV